MIDVLTADEWLDYELIDSGGGEKLERWGQYRTVRPEPRAVWNKYRPEMWQRADAVFRSQGEHGQWIIKQPPPDPWTIGYKDLRFRLKPTDFRHTGVFPEQAVNWDWITGQVKARRERNRETEIKVLNLFAYTGGASLAAAAAGAKVTHVDGSRPAINWAGENARLTGIAPDRIRWIPDDAGKFVKRELNRKGRYDGIVMDPPKFGRGTKNEVWKLLEDLPGLVNSCRRLLSDQSLFWLINVYAAEVSALGLENLLTGATAGLAGKVQAGELALAESAGGRRLPAGVFARWSPAGQPGMAFKPDSV